MLLQRFPILLAVATLAFATDAAPQNAAKDAIRAPMASQVEAVASMKSPLASQRLALKRQLGQVPSGSFFLLPPPARIGSSSGTYRAADCDPLPGSQIEDLITGAANRANLPPDLLRSMVNQESGFRPCAVSPKGAMGLMQLMPATATQLGVSDPFNPKENVDAGAKLVKHLLEIYGDLPMALGAYNAGPSRVDDAKGIPNIPETLNYVQKILSSMPPKK
jgi:soluble lytic murein transglycosylase-like protein